MKTITLLKANKYLYASYYCDDERLRYPTGVKEGGISDSDQLKLERIDKLVEKYIVNYRDVLEKPVLKNELYNYLDQKLKPELKKKTTNRNFFEDCEFLIKGMRDGKILKKKTNDRYAESTLKHFEGILRKLNSLSLTIDYSFSHKDLNKLIVHLTSQDASRNYIFNIVHGLQWLLARTFDAGYHSNKVFEIEEFDFEPEEKDAIALKLGELEDLYKLQLTGAKERARDFLLWGCFVALRIKDLSRVNEYHLYDNRFEFLPSKTGEKIIIPVHPIAREIYEKYGGNIPIFKRSAFRLHLPVLCKLAKIKGKKLIVITKGGVKTKSYKERWELVTPHTMRRTFATIMYWEFGFRPKQIMPITGHSTEAIFFDYIKIEKEDNISSILEHPAFKKRP